MARLAAQPYTLGHVSFRPHPSRAGDWQARAEYRDDNNAVRQVSHLVSAKDWDASEKKAKKPARTVARQALEAKMTAARDAHRGGDSVLRHDTKMPQAAAAWLDWKAREDKSATTMRDYRGYVERSINVGPLAKLTVMQANDVARIEAWLTTIADERGETAARQSRKVLSGILGLAERRGAIPASVMHRAKTPKAKPGTTGDRKCQDADCDYDCGKRHLDTRRAFTADEAAAVLAAAEGAKADVGDLAHFLFGTGVRISEALHCTSWDDVDLDGQTVRVRGTKTKQADRTLGLSDDLTKRLRARAKTHGTKGLVFGVTYFTTKLGEPRDRNNVSKALRRVFAAADVKWAGTHTFRRTVATWMDDAGHSLASIANQLGHADTNVTAKYLGRQDKATHAAAVMVLPSKPEKSSKGHFVRSDP